MPTSRLRSAELTCKFPNGLHVLGDAHHEYAVVIGSQACCVSGWMSEPVAAEVLLSVNAVVAPKA
ncbi:MAG: hypothetical protein L7F78_15505, partial [Syntrophales bacterium LBB04]|nr:hypothetical protein [Syntrophales bacterium LBB04]